jgi:hypothetical protein
MRIVYFQYWWQVDANITFPLTFGGFESLLLHLRKCGVVVDGKLAMMVLVVLLAWNLDVQQGLFKFNMKSNIAQVMAKMVALIIDKVHPMCRNPNLRLTTKVRGVARLWAKRKPGSHITYSRECRKV